MASVKDVINGWIVDVRKIPLPKRILEDYISDFVVPLRHVDYQNTKRKIAIGS